MRTGIKTLIAGAVVMSFVAIGSLWNSQPAGAQGPAGGLSVQIVNPLPVPITGSTTISGSVAATQSGPWSVGISGTPEVRLATTANNPVISQDVSKLASNLVRLSSGLVSPGTESATSKVTPDGVFTAFVVPNDRSLVVTSIDIEPVSPGAGTNSVFLTSGPDVAAVGRWTVQNSSASQFVFQSGIVFPAGSVVKVRSIPASTGQVLVTLGGYLTAS